MDYLFLQMLFCLLIATIIGGVIGWFLRSFSCNKLDVSKEDVKSFQARINELEGENSKFKILSQRFEEDANDLNAQIVKITKERDQFKERAYDIEASASSKAIGESEEFKDYYDIEEIEGIGKGFGKRLRSIDIATTTDLLAKSTTLEERELIIKTVKVEPVLVEAWINMANLIQVPGIRGQFAELLEASGITSVDSLAQQKPSDLTQKMKEVNEKEHRTRVNPTEEMVFEWIGAAKKLV